MTKKTDNDGEIIPTILSALDQVSEERRERILRSVLAYYDLTRP